jgi:pimeloyl-ACP methyl ester carboxylesterase
MLCVFDRSKVLLSMAFLVLAVTLVRGQSPSAGEEVQFETVDKVELHGTFYAPTKLPAPVILILHKYGGNRQQPGWKELIKELQKDYAVLSFDFRGHGESTNVVPEVFWRVPNNQFYIKNAARFPAKIDYHDFNAVYMPMLANDVAAARYYLEKQKSTACNVSNIAVIGAEQGAAIGALWIAYEMEKRRLIKNSFGMLIPDPQGHTEGEDIAGAVWLSIPKTLNGVHVGLWLRGRLGRTREKAPMAFFYGDKDRKAGEASQALYEELRRTTREKSDQTRLRAKDTKLQGHELLNDSLNTIEEINAYVEKITQKHGGRAGGPREAETAPLSLIPLSAFGLSGLR